MKSFSPADFFLCQFQNRSLILIILKINLHKQLISNILYKFYTFIRQNKLKL